MRDDQLNAVMRTILDLPVEKRTIILKRIGARLQLPDNIAYSEFELDNAVRVAVRELIQEFHRPPGAISWLDQRARRARIMRFQ